MRNTLSFLVGLGLVVGVRASVGASLADNDGFQRRNGQMYVLRNGQLRAMTRDSRLPTGALVSKDGFITDARGRRTELREGQGCDLKGNIVAVAPTAAGGLALAQPARASRTIAVARLRPAPEAYRLLGGPGRPGGPGLPGGPGGYGPGPAERRDAEGEGEKRAEKEWEHRRKEEEKRWERERKHAEKADEHGRKWEKKRHKGHKWDD